MTCVVGLGCQRGCEVHILLALFEAALAEGGIDRQRITALASLDRKQNEPGLLDLARLLELPLQCFSATQLAVYQDRLSHKSAVAFAHTGCYGIAESAALALAEQFTNAPARLLITRQKNAQATFALACSD
ncbi:cobalamin biosynthesis protein [Pseudomonas lactucae]|uniref:Cobalamin biosynthesis protein n=1 Tax=Pseudomonas lactucae TaxID=2813360 RepID=A0A9X1C7E9_9PSED|nr:cobalamin biosynthesis protein [Pseudomonas lactucae]MBN2977707.1 cobalamin biosynthesis protein [Pseudomonas lactucae]MBN2987181.1 cobalamin biosynthesis protein [Pseudomonas lactucae]